MSATEPEIWNIIKLSPAKSCGLNPLPTCLLKECKAELVPLITDIVNMSLRESMIPKSLKTSFIRPLLKKTGLDSDILKKEWQNDILSALDASSSAILLMLDLSVAFDTRDHDILLSRLCNVYGITGNALDWFRSYLTGRLQSVVIEDSVSVDQELDFGVPQCSVLGPRIYCMYTHSIS